MIAAERETTVNASDDDELVRVWTAQRAVITRLRRDSAFTEVGSGVSDGTEWAEFTTPADRWTPAGVRRTRNISDEQRERLRSRLRSSENAHNVGAESVEDGAE